MARGHGVQKGKDEVTSPTSHFLRRRTQTFELVNNAMCDPVLNIPSFVLWYSHFLPVMYLQVVFTLSKKKKKNNKKKKHMSLNYS
jgi:hypothetical protein